VIHPDSLFFIREKYSLNERGVMQYIIKAAACCFVPGSLIYLSTASVIASRGMMEYGTKNPGNMVMVHCFFFPLFLFL
jgi:hypothetical protein